MELYIAAVILLFGVESVAKLFYICGVLPMYQPTPRKLLVDVMGNVVLILAGLIVLAVFGRLL